MDQCRPGGLGYGSSAPRTGVPSTTGSRRLLRCHKGLRNLGPSPPSPHPRPHGNPCSDLHDWSRPSLKLNPRRPLRTPRPPTTRPVRLVLPVGLRVRSESLVRTSGSPQKQPAAHATPSRDPRPTRGTAPHPRRGGDSPNPWGVTLPRPRGSAGVPVILTPPHSRRVLTPAHVEGRPGLDGLHADLVRTPTPSRKKGYHQPTRPVRVFDRSPSRRGLGSLGLRGRSRPGNGKREMSYSDEGNSGWVDVCRGGWGPQRVQDGVHTEGETLSVRTRGRGRD